MGNPLNYVGKNAVGDLLNATLEWSGRQLSAVVRNETRYEYFYNPDGLRTSVREYNSRGELQKITYYIWNGGKLSGYYIDDQIRDHDTTVKMVFDNNGDAVGFKIIEGQTGYTALLYFQKNLQGDIVGVYDESARYVLGYSYDAWGNVSVIIPDDSASGSYRASIALLYTPITYRGYMYDPHIGLYYLQSRYYNPTYGRFLNADTTEILEATQGTPLGANLFAYCNNNPVNMVDTTGMNPALVAGGLNFLFECLVVIVLILILVYSITYATTGTIGNAESKYYSPEAFLQALNQMYETIKRYEELLRTALYTAAILALVKGLDGCNNHDHHIIAQTSPKAQIARDYFTSNDVGGKITDSANIVGVKNVFHYFIHTDIYYMAINALIVESYYFHGELSRRESVYSMLASIKLTIEFFDAAVPLG